MPKIMNPRNHYRADTDANTQGLISKLELASKYTDTAEQGLGPCGGVLLLRACLGDLQNGWSNSSSSVYILIWGLQGH